MFHIPRSRRALVGLALASAAALAAGGTAAADYIDPTSPPFEGTTRIYRVIEAKHSGLVLNVPDASTVNGSTVIQWSRPDAMNSQWELLVAPGDRKFIRNRWSRQCLHVDSAAPGPVVQRPCDGSAKQRWKLSFPTSPAPNITHHITNEYSGLDLNISGGSGVPGAQLIQYPRVPGAPNTLFKIPFHVVED
jgi:Ricin-type beta-trefoil lectin domain-like